MKNLATKLLAFQKEVGAIPKDSVNPFFKSKYADINTYIEVVKPLLSKHGLVLLQPLSSIDGKSGLLTMIIDSESGEHLDMFTMLPENPDPQKMGAIITYFRRYAIQSMLCLEAEDNDGQDTSYSTPITKTPVKPISDHIDHSKNPPTDEELNELFGGEVIEEPKIANAEQCNKCGAERILNPKTGKMFCKEKCWLKK